MAIKLSTSTLVEPFDYISRDDSAIDSSGDDFEDVWQNHREHGTELPLKEGQEPTVFKLAPLSGNKIKARLADIQARQGDVTAAVAACAVSLKGVRNLQDETGRPFKIEHTRDEGFEVVTPECLDKLPLGLVIELGTVAFQSMSPSQD